VLEQAGSHLYLGHLNDSGTDRRAGRAPEQESIPITRSWHTEPPRVRGPRRVAAPFASRGNGDQAGQRRALRLLKVAGLLPREGSEQRQIAVRGPIRIAETWPGSGWFHPAGRSEVVALLKLLGPSCTYGLGSVELARRRAGVGPAQVVFGELRVPGRILLYEQPLPPWTLPGRLRPLDAQRLNQAGASIEVVGAGLQTVVDWPGSTLTRYMLFDVLAHEVAHHVLQQYTGKRLAQIVRRRDHEAIAERFARWAREHYGRSNPDGTE
jgi:hypothetical protein